MGGVKVKTLSLYQCEFCGTQFNQAFLCKNCEERHRKPIGVEAMKYVAYGDDKTGMPVTVKVTMHDGTSATYKRVK